MNDRCITVYIICYHNQNELLLYKVFLNIMIEIHQLRLIQQLSHCQFNMSRAAERLHLSQPAISKQLKLLEDRLQLTLIDRQQRPFKLTLAGQHLLDLANHVLPLMAQGEAQLLTMMHGEHPQLRIALECDICYDWLMPAISSYQQQYPQVDIDLVTSQTHSPSVLLEQRMADFVLATQLPEKQHLSAHRLFDYELQVILPAAHALAQRDVITAHDFVDQCVIHFPRHVSQLDLFRQVLMPAHVRPKQTREHHLVAGIAQLVAAGKGIAALPNWAIHQLSPHLPIVVKSIGITGTWTTLYGITRAEDSGKYWIRAFVQTIKQQQSPIPPIR